MSKCVLRGAEPLPICSGWIHNCRVLVAPPLTIQMHYCLRNPCWLDAHPTMINDFDWFGIATDGPIVDSLEIGAFTKPRLWAGKSVYKHANIIYKCVLRGAEHSQFAVGGRASLPQTFHVKMYKTHCIAYPIVVSLLSLPLQLKCANVLGIHADWMHTHHVQWFGLVWNRNRWTDSR